MMAWPSTSRQLSWSTSTISTQIRPYFLRTRDSGRARVLMHYADNPYDSSFAALVGEVFFKPKGQADQDVIAKAKQELNACFERLERELGNNEYLLGAFTIADIGYVAWA